MKILRNLVVTGSLLQGETGEVAAVGDTIVLYLDETYNPGFPASINGTIDSATLVNCDSATSYDVEYDEADLEGSGVSFLRPEDVTDYLVLNSVGVVAVDLEAEAAARIEGDSTPSVLAALQGDEEDPDRIGAEYLPEVIPVVAVTLSDTTGLILPAGSLGLDASGNLVLHDGVTAGGNPVGSDDNRYTGTVVVTAAQSAVAYNVQVFTFPITPADAVAGKHLRVIGRVWGRSSGTQVTGKLGISTAQQRTASGGVIIPGVLSGITLPPSGVDSNTIFNADVDFTGVLTTTSTYLTLTTLAGTTPDGFNDRITTSVLNRQAQNFSVLSLTRFTTGGSEAIRVYLVLDSTTGTDFRLNYDLQIFFE